MGSRYNKTLHYFAFFTAFMTFILIIAGGLVTSTGSGLATHDWPLANAQLMPEMKGTMFYEYSHRIIAATVGFLTLILTIWLLLREERRWVRNFGIGAFGAVVAQGLLGALTVKLHLPPAVSILHAGLAQGFFCLIICVTIFTSRPWSESMPSVGVEIEPRYFRHGWGTASHIYIQILLGAWLRHTSSVVALLSHIIMAVIVGINVLALSVRIFDNYGKVLYLKIPAYLMAIFFIGQLVLGPLSLLLTEGKVVSDTPRALLPSAVITTHVAIGALLFASSIILTLRLYRFTTNK